MSGQTTTIVNSLTITSTTPSTFSIIPTTSSGGNWLAAIPASGNTGTIVQITTNPAGLPNGTYTGNLSVVVWGPGTRNVPVTMTVGAGGGGGTEGYGVSPNRVFLGYQPGGSFPQNQGIILSSPSPQAYTASIHYPVGQQQNWLFADPLSGATVGTPGSAQIPIQLGVVPTSLPQGFYTATLLISISGQTLLVPVGLSIQSCGFSFNPASRTAPATPDTVGSLSVTASGSNCARTAVR